MKKNYRPFKSSDELVKTVYKRVEAEIGVKIPYLTPILLPQIWVRLKDTNEVYPEVEGTYQILGYTSTNVFLEIGKVTFEELLNNFDFPDGSVCGVEE